jgi:hypothetical protein
MERGSVCWAAGHHRRRSPAAEAGGWRAAVQDRTVRPCGGWPHGSDPCAPVRRPGPPTLRERACEGRRAGDELSAIASAKCSPPSSVSRCPARDRDARPGDGACEVQKGSAVASQGCFPVRRSRVPATFRARQRPVCRIPVQRIVGSARDGRCSERRLSIELESAGGPYWPGSPHRRREHSERMTKRKAPIT